MVLAPLKDIRMYPHCHKYSTLFFEPENEHEEEYEIRSARNKWVGVLIRRPSEKISGAQTSAHQF